MTHTEAMLSKSLFLDMTKTLAAPLLASCAYPWEVLGELNDFILSVGKGLSEQDFRKISDHVWVHKSAAVAQSAVLTGPLIVCEGAQVRHCAFVRGSAIIGKGAVVGNSTEIKNAVLFDGVQVPHFNYVGDSVLGYRAHLGAGAITSNVRLDRGEIAVKYGELTIKTGRKKCGAMVGDFAEVGSNCVLNPGTVVPPHSHIKPLSSVRGYYEKETF